MKLNAEEQSMLAGEQGEARRWAIEHQRQVGRMFDAEDMVEVEGTAVVLGMPCVTTRSVLGISFS